MRALKAAVMWMVAFLVTEPVPDGVWLTWELPVWGSPECPTAPERLYLHEAYLGPGTGIWDYYDGVQLLTDVNQTALLLSPGKPEVGCGIMWGGGPDQRDFIPLALDSGWWPLPAECQPFNLLADGLTWEGI